MFLHILESSRAEYLTQKMLGTDIEQSTNFFNRHSAMIDRIRAFYGNLPEKGLDFCDLLKLCSK